MPTVNEPSPNEGNVFLLLGLDPEDPWSLAVLERQLRARKAEWSRLVTNGIQTDPKVIAARRRLKLLPALQEIANDEVRREQHRAVARSLRERDRAERRRDCGWLLDLWLLKGFLHAAEEARLNRDYGDLLSGDTDLAQRLESADIRPDDPQPRDVEGLDATRMGSIRANLDDLGERSLYTLLARVDPTIDAKAPLDKLAAAADELYRQVYQVTDKSQPGLNAKNVLAGHAKELFSTPAKRAQYNASLDAEPLDKLLRRYQMALESSRYVDPAQAARFLEDADRQGISADLAKARLVRHFSELRWAVALPLGAAGTTMAARARCWSCQVLSRRGDDYCASCGEPFELDCPSCGTRVPAQDSCTRCGFRIGNRHWARFLLDEAEAALRAGDVSEAAAKLAQAALDWPLPPTSDHDLAVRTRELAGEARGFRDRQRLAAADLADVVGARRYQAAASELQSSWKGLIPEPDRRRALEEARDRIAEAERLCRLAGARGTPSERAAELYLAALEACADHEPAHAALRLLPPEPPASLRASPSADLVHLTWQPSPTAAVRYVVVRGRGGRPPVSANDGTVLGVVEAVAYDDADPRVGVPVHYAVFADRAGTASKLGTVTSSPVLLVQDAEITSKTILGGTVTLTWTLPPNADGVLVRRTEEPLEGGTVVPGAGDAGTGEGAPRHEVVVTEGTRLVQQGLREDRCYTFQLRARFRDAEGRVRLSPGRTVSLVPSLPPDPLRSFSVTAVRTKFDFNPKVQLRWDPVQHGDVEVLVTDTRPPFRAGDSVPVSEFRRHGRTIKGSSPVIDDLVPTGSGLYVFVPAVVLGEVAHVGQPRRYAAVKEVRDLTAEGDADTIRLRWIWPENAREVLVAHEPGAWPADPAATAVTSVVVRAAGEPAGRHDLRHGHHHDHDPGAEADGGRSCTVVVAVVRWDDGERFTSSGAKCEVALPRRNVVTYEIVRSRRRPLVRLRAQRHVSLPGLVVVSRRDRPPAGPDDGEVVHREGPVDLDLDLELRLPASARGAHVRVYPAATGGDPGFVIRHPDAGDP